MLKIAIVSDSSYRSPRVLAECLHEQVKCTKATSKVFHRINAFKRLLKYDDVKHKYKLHLWIGYKFLHFFKDFIFVKKLKSYDAIIICGCPPDAFLKDCYGIEKLRRRIGNIPILFYEVYYLGNAPTQLSKLRALGGLSMERYDWHLAVGEIAEIRQKPSRPWSQIGLYLKSTGLKPKPKKRLLAIVDFVQPGFQDIRKNQIQVLEDLDIPYIALEGNYTISEIRNIYMNSTFYFMQSFEAFGLPIAECLCCGSYIFSPQSSWPMSWRLDENPIVHGEGILPECFVIYNDPIKLKSLLSQILKSYDYDKTPQKVFDIFIEHYPTFFEGNGKQLAEVLDKIQKKELNNSLIV